MVAYEQVGSREKRAVDDTKKRIYKLLVLCLYQLDHDDGPGNRIYRTYNFQKLTVAHIAPGPHPHVISVTL
jgi:hypothetical protein